MNEGQFEFSSMGIGRLLKHGRMAVPPNQRPYSWEDQHVDALLDDLQEAIEGNESDYFLGTIVLVNSDVDQPSIVDGQQRLATTSIIFASIRDKIFELRHEESGRTIDRDFLRQHNISTNRREPRLKLSTEDNEFFANNILRAPYDTEAAPEIDIARLRSSNIRLKNAAKRVDEFFVQLLKDTKSSNRAEVLVKWAQFLDERARVVVVRVPDEFGAYRMFETLNDRGLRASQADILKNHFFSRITQPAVWTLVCG
ncbi:MAG: DUF262 domain-containing protein [Rhodomicrobium sp.]